MGVDRADSKKGSRCHSRNFKLRGLGRRQREWLRSGNEEQRGSIQYTGPVGMRAEEVETVPTGRGCTERHVFRRLGR